MPVCCLPVTGALSCHVLVNGNRASAIIDTGSAISLIIEEFAKKCACEIEPWGSHVVRVVTGSEFIITRACLVGRCGVLPSFPTDLLLGMDFLRNSEFWIDLGTMQLRDPGNQNSAISLFVLPRVANAEEATKAYSYVEEIMPEDEPELSLPGQLGDSVVHDPEPGWSRGDLQEAVPEETPRTPIPSPMTVDGKSATAIRTRRSP